MNVKGASDGKREFYITTPIYYPNALPHVGTAYTTIIADFVARFKRSQGYDVFFLTGNDEHGMKIARVAEKNGMTPQEFVDGLAEKFKDVWKQLGITYNRFIRTTDKDHEKTVKEIIIKSNKNGDIYKGYYEGYYCVDCEQYYTEKDLVDGKCPIHNKPLEILSMESYFFKLSAYQDRLLKFYKDNKEFLPSKYKQEVINRVKKGLRDISISRPKRYLTWGIEFPLDQNHVTYVWFDALTNYLTGIGYSCSENEKNKEMFNRYWPADIHFIGKDITWFHCVIWPAILMSVGLPLPKRVGINGFLSVDGKKISKSLGNAIDPVSICDYYETIDVLRYYLLREIPFGSDGDFSRSSLKERYNNELVNEYSNLVNRVFVMFSKYCSKSHNGNIDYDDSLWQGTDEIIKSYIKHIDRLEFKQAIDTIWQLISKANSYINEKEPWKLAKGDDGSGNGLEKAAKVIYSLIEYLGIINSLFAPILPSSSEKLAKHLGLKEPIRISELKQFGKNIDIDRVNHKGLILYRRKE